MDPDRHYYANLFPATHISKFLKRHATRVSRYKEMALRWNIDGKVIPPQRYNSYSNPKSMRADIVRRLPIGLFVGPTYNFDPSLRFVLGLGRLRPVEHKLIFDIDLTDYDDIRRCACVNKTSGLRCCSKCWPLAACAIIILRNLLHHKFGFHEFLFTFSGSKGTHCWVLDQEVQSWEDSARLNLSEYFRPFISVKAFTHSAPIQCHVLRQCYLDVIKPLFEQHVVGHVVHFNTEHGRNLVRVCAYAHNVTNVEFIEKLPPISNPLHLWHYIEAQLVARELRPVVRSVIMMCTFPRLDKDITTSMQHLIRCPFSINGFHGKLCLPIRYQESLSFSPSSAPDSQSIDNDQLRHYLEVLEEAMTAPWSRLWVCRVCEGKNNIANYKAENIFLYEDEWQQHYETLGHGVSYEAHNSTAKAVAKEQYEKPTPAEKRRVFLTLLNIKHRE